MGNDKVISVISEINFENESIIDAQNVANEYFPIIEASFDEKFDESADYMSYLNNIQIYNSSVFSPVTLGEHTAVLKGLKTLLQVMIPYRCVYTKQMLIY